MRTLFCFIAILFLTVTSSGQIVKSQSNAEEFSKKSGTLIQKEFFTVGKLKDVEYKVVHYTDLISGAKQSALKLEIEVSGKYSSDTKIGILDADEVDGLIKSITIMKNTIFTKTPTNYEEVVFTSRCGFSAGCFWSTDKWSTFMQIEEFDNDSFVFLTIADFDTLLSILNKAVPLLTF